MLSCNLVVGFERQAGKTAAALFSVFFFFGE